MGIVAGLIGELIEGSERWAFFGFSIIWILANVHSSGSSCGYATGFAQEYGSRAFQAVGVKKVGVITVQGEAYAHTVLDIIAKSLVGLMVVCHDSSTEDVPDTPACHSSKGGLRGLC